MNYFAYPEMAAWAAVPVSLWVLGRIITRSRRQSLHVLGHAHTVTRMLPEGLASRRRWMDLCRVGGLSLIVIALCGPLLGSKLVEFKQKGLDAFVAVDCSQSMRAEDMMPNRMAHARLLLGQLIDRLAGSRIGVIAFAGSAHVQCPLTVDTGAAQQILESIDVGTIPTPGSAIGDAIRVASKGLKAGEGGHRVLILLTDGEDHRSKPLDAAKDAAKTGLKIFTVGIGAQDGEPIPELDESGKRTGYKRDKKGDVVMSRMDEKTLLEVARETGGQYFRASTTGGEIDDLLRALQGLQQGDQKAKLFNRYENRYQWPLAIGILLLFISLLIPEQRWKN